ncbi:MAG: hypothetical protein M0P74_18040 [Syntrophales bacterium]|nr:hypothetical protein [Syntrophales bacterium]
MKAKGVLKKSDNQSFYVVTQKGFAYLWLQICSSSFFKNPMISRTIKNDACQLATQPSQIEEAYDTIQRGLSKLTQQLAIVPCP